MPQARLSMRKTREVLRLRLDRRRTQQEVATACNISPSTVWDTMRRFKASGLAWPLPDSVSDNELEARLYPSESPADQGEKPVPDWPALHAGRKLAKNVTLTLLWEEYKHDHPDGYEYSWFCQAYRDWVKTIDPVMRQTYRFGEKCFVDYAGETVSIVDPVTGEVTEAQIFVGTLGASNFTFAEAQPSQDLFSWTMGHVRMFQYFGGVPEVLMPDYVARNIIGVMFPTPLCCR